jgi:UTP--glucose-1-phosphate uridylyltransferase
MLPVGRRVVVQHVMAELRAAGVTDVLAILSTAKMALIAALEEAGSPRVYTVMQQEMRGLGDAVSLASPFTGTDAFFVALPDTVMKGEPGALLRRMATCQAATGAAAVVAVEEVAPEAVSRYGIVAPASAISEYFPVSDIVEKPRVETAPSRWAVCARFLLDARVYPALEAARQELAQGEELGLTPTLPRLLAEGSIYAVPLLPGEERLDIGHPAGYRRAFLRLSAEEEDAPDSG